MVTTGIMQNLNDERDKHPNHSMSRNPVQVSPLFREILRGPENVNGFKINYLQRLAENGRRLKVMVKKPPILPPGSKELLLSSFKTSEYKYMIEDTFRYLEDQRIVHDVSRGIDGKLKGRGVKQGLAIISSPGLVLMEHEPGATTDLKNTLKELYLMKELSVPNYKNHIPTISHILNPLLPIPVENVLLYGTWSRPAVVCEEGLYDPVTRLKVSLIDAQVYRFKIEDKKKPGFWPTDITQIVQDKLAESGKQKGHAVITTPHTTVSILELSNSDLEPLRRDLEKIAPDNAAHYHHNIINKEGRLEVDEENEPFGDSNGQSHVNASLTGSFDVIPYENGRLELKEGKRLYHIDYDTLEPRLRHWVVSFVDQ